MPQKLSAMRYIKNNKRRVSVLVVSLCLSFVLTYLTQFLLSTNTETFLTLFEHNPKKIQYISLASSSLGIDVDNLTLEEIMPIREQRIAELMEALKQHEGVKEVYYAELLYTAIYPVIGSMSLEIPLVPAEELPVLLEHFDATLVEGRMPEQPGEIILSRSIMKNNDRYTLNGSFYTDTDQFRIVGIIDCESYFGCGIPHPDLPRSKMITVLSKDIEDFTAILAEEGIIVRDTYDTVQDYNYCMKMYEEDVIAAIEPSTTMISVVITLLLSVSLFIVYTTYLKDRRDEWCLYCSIGYSRKTIYFSILRELLFTFVTALLIGALLIAVAELLLYFIMIEPQGLKCRFFHPRALFEILCTYVLLLGVLQLPVRLELSKIRTIDAMEDDL